MPKTSVMSKARKNYPSHATEFEIERSQISIAIYKKGIKCTSFVVGDVAEYDSYNLRYTGTITKITDKCVSIVAYYGSQMAKTHRLDMQSFCWHNWNFNATECARYNATESMYI
jgi:hypothetical protein